MTLISLENVSKQYRTDPVLEGVTLGIEAGDRIGIIGANGSGKSTLLRIMAGEEATDGGRLTLANGARIVMLSQQPVLDASLSVLDAIFEASTEAMRLIAEYEQACQDLAHDPSLQRRVSELTASLEASGAWELETRARTVLSRLGIEDVKALVGTLSGGQRKRVALAHALIHPADVLLLDEPTNHLDVTAIAWLERFVRNFSGALVLVTHDRYFLDRLGTRMVEIEKGRIKTYMGNYAAYLEQKQVEREQDAAEAEKRSNLMRRELAWLRRGARARATKQKAHVERARALLEAPADAPEAALEIVTVGRRLGNKGVEMRHVSKTRGDRMVVRDCTLDLQKGDRIGIVGPNGCGKTTLLELIAQRLAPDQGTVDQGPTVALGYYDQESRELPEAMRAIDYVQEKARLIETSDGGVITASQMLERFLFPGPIQYAPIERLSGGERRRLYLLRVLMENPNLLIFDEPTNDLDIPTLQRLEAFLDTFSGILVVVSHDRYFLDRTVDTILYFTPEGRVQEYMGNGSAWLEEHEADRPVEQPRPKAAAGVGPLQVKPRERRLSFKERQELQTLEADIESGEARLKAIAALLAADSSDYDATIRLYSEQEHLRASLDLWTTRWTELSDIPP